MSPQSVISNGFTFIAYFRIPFLCIAKRLFNRKHFFLFNLIKNNVSKHFS